MEIWLSLRERDSGKKSSKRDIALVSKVADDLAAGAGAEGAPDVESNVVAHRPHRAVHEEHVDDARMVAARRDRGIGQRVRHRVFRHRNEIDGFVKSAVDV